jgi:TATA-box binding protein (TBP) (component of TFIID and TFIIIB)
MSIDDDWMNFMNGDEVEETIPKKITDKGEAPEPDKLHISTQTKIAYLNIPVDINMLFWNLPIIEFHESRTGILKKQMKLTTHDINDTEKFEEQIKEHYNGSLELITLKTDKYKCVQKASIGLSNKDVINFKAVNGKRAFYNCVALVMRIYHDETYKEFHIKMFNTGKMEIPGIRESHCIHVALGEFMKILNVFYPEAKYMESIRTILINSNFKCGYEIDRQKCVMMLKTKYSMIAMYDPCLYPGVQCKFYYNEDNEIQDGVCRCKKRCGKKGTGKGENQCKEISFMIFRTGSILIVGNCEESQLREIYNVLKQLFYNEYVNLVTEGDHPLDDAMSVYTSTTMKTRKLRSKILYVK